MALKTHRPAAMLSSVLKSKKAVTVNIEIMRTFAQSNTSGKAGGLKRV
jgi:hypothetical protein